MLKTTSRKFKENFRNFVIENAEYNESPANYAEAVQIIKADFIRSHWGSESVRRYFGNNPFTAFEDYMQGLPLLFDYYYGRAVKQLGNILEETEEERNQYTEDQAAAMLTRLLYKAVVIEG